MWTLITGASSGIGLELARIFASHGHDLILTGRSGKKLEEIAVSLRTLGVKTEVVTQDLAVRDGADELVSKLDRFEIDTLVNNAGFGQYGPFLETDPKEELDMMQVNMIVPTRLTKLLLPAMVRRQRGGILNVASSAAFQPGPLMAVYYASKAYLLHWSEALANEVREHGVTVTALCPGATKTSFQDRAQMSRTRLFTGTHIATAREVAEAGYGGLMAKKTVVIPGTYNRLRAFGTRLIPRDVVTKLARGVQEPRR